ncbi:MAG: hypothetical protein ACFNLH_04020, partial [Corynebacterium matruchotii]
MPIGVGSHEGVTELEHGRLQDHGNAQGLPLRVKAVDIDVLDVAQAQLASAHTRFRGGFNLVGRLQAESDVVGEFKNARPAGAAAGENESPRYNAMAFDITTGALLDWALTVLPAKDGKRFSSVVSWGKLNPTRHIAA